MKKKQGFTHTPNNNLFTNSQKRSRGYIFGYCKGPKANLVSGFTIIEILVVVSIISLLTSVVLANLQDAREKARDARRVSDLTEMRKLSQLLHSEPATVFAGCMTDNSVVSACSSPDFSKYHDPIRSLDACNSTSDGPCEYSVSGGDGNVLQGILGIIDSPNTQDFQICAYLERGAGSIKSGLVSVGSATDGAIASGCK